MIVLSEYLAKNSESTRDLQRMTEAAKTLGCQVHFIPGNFDDCS